MFRKVLIVEDFESFNISIQKVVKDLKVDKPDYAFYCDDAFLKIRKALNEGEPYDLLITDLSFEEDHRIQKLKSGKDLIKAVKEIQEHIKVIVFSVEKKTKMVEGLFENYGIDGFVAKGREDSKDLKKAVQVVFAGGKHLGTEMKRNIKQKNTYEITSYDVTIVSLLSNGILLKDISNHLKENNIKPASQSSIEKRLAILKESFELKSNHQLIALFKDLGSI